MNNKLNPQTLETWKYLYEHGMVEFKSKEDLTCAALDTLFEEKQQEVQELLEKCSDGEYVTKMTLAELLLLPFESARSVIESMSLKKRIDMLNELDKRLLFTYEKTNNYCGVCKAELITAAEFRSLLGKIKHMEILQQWLYGIS